MKFKGMFFLLMVSVVFFFSSCSSAEETLEPVWASHSGMGTITEFTVFGEQAENAIETGKEIMVDIEQKMSVTIENSEVNEIIAQAGIQPVQVSDETFEVIKRGIYFSELTKGRFDISIAPIINLWNIGNNDQKVPSESEIQEELLLVDYKNIILDEKDKSVFLEKKGMKIDLGGIAKGYATDQVIKAFRELEIEDALISVGGNIKVLGDNPQKNRSWRIGLRHPREARGSQFGTTSLEDGETVVSSGDYERFFIEDDIRYHHIFDAMKGKPSESDIIGVSIIADNSMEADGVSTSVFLLGSQEGIRLIEKLEGVEAILITKDLKVIMTEGARQRVEIENMQL